MTKEFRCQVSGVRAAAGLKSGQSNRKRDPSSGVYKIANIEYRMSKECILPAVSFCVERSIL